MRALGPCAIIFASFLLLSGCEGGCFICDVPGDPEEPAATARDVNPPSPNPEGLAGTSVDTSCHVLATQRADDEAGQGFDEAMMQRIIARTYSDCLAAKKRFEP